MNEDIKIRRSEKKEDEKLFQRNLWARIRGNYPSRASGRTVVRRRFISIGDGNNRRTLIYDRDVANAALLAVQHPNAAGKVYNVSDGQFHTLKEIIVAICHAIGHPPPRDCRFQLVPHDSSLV